MNHKICETIKNLRISRSISQENFANELGISAQAVSKWENHKALPDISLLPKIADYFHVTIDTLFKGIIQDENYWLDNISDSLEMNRIGWNGIVAKYLRTNGTFIFSWDNPILPCIESSNEQYVLKHSYLDELLVQEKKREELIVRTNRKLATYINTLARNGFIIECLIEDSMADDSAIYSGGYYSGHKAQYINHSFVLKARKL